MKRFPMLTTYRGVLQILAVVVVLVGCFVSIILAYDADGAWNSSTHEYQESFSIFYFLSSAMVFGGIALALLITAELIQLALAVEDHLYQIRSELTRATPGKNKRRLGER